jgi:hypothetical protein
VLVRLHGAGLEERQQIKWFAYAAVVLTSAILLRVQTLGWASARPYARPPYLMTASWRSRFVKGGIQPKAGHEGDRFSQLAAAIEEHQGSVCAIGYGHYISRSGYQRLGIKSSCQDHSQLSSWKEDSRK